MLDPLQFVVVVAAGADRLPFCELTREGCSLSGTGVGVATTATDAATAAAATVRPTVLLANTRPA